MRPIERGNVPIDSATGTPFIFDPYTLSRPFLIERLGQYCSFCEARIPSNLHVEHILPKELNPNQKKEWGNFLLACVNCNSTKSDKPVVVVDYYWPDIDNSFWVLVYTDDGKIAYNPIYPGILADKVERTVKLTGLDKYKINATSSDRRWINRQEVWIRAKTSKLALQSNNNDLVRELIVTAALGYGFWSVWMTVFQDDADMLRRLIEAFPGTALSCFDPAMQYQALVCP